MSKFGHAHARDSSVHAGTRQESAKVERQQKAQAKQAARLARAAAKRRGR
jgi:hypothetical protein